MSWCFGGPKPWFIHPSKSEICRPTWKTWRIIPDGVAPSQKAHDLGPAIWNGSFKTRSLGDENETLMATVAHVSDRLG